MWGLLKALQIDVTKRGTHRQLHLAPRPTPANDDWRKRVRNLMTFPNYPTTLRFLNEVVVPACEEVAEALRKEGATVNVIRQDDRIGIEVPMGEEHDFRYESGPRPPHAGLHYGRNAWFSGTYRVFPCRGVSDRRRPELRRDGMEPPGIIADILDQYSRHLHFLHLVR